MTTIEDLEAKIASYDERLAGLSKAYDDLKKDTRMMVTGDSPQSMQIAYSPTLKSKVFEKAPFFRFLESKGRLPNFVTYKDYRLAVRLYTYFFAKVLVAYENNNQKYVEKVNITSKVFTKPTETRNVVYDYLAKKTGKKFKTIDDLLTYVKSNFTYQSYFDDKKSNKEVIDSKSGNCTDLLQFLINMATAMGYESKCIHVKCKTSGIGHVFGKFKHPKNTNGKWITRDIACVAKDGSITCVWCENGTLLAENPSWFLVNLNR